MITEYNDDMTKAASDGSMDPFCLAAKYCHKFVNIHPFADGNGRTCRIILTAMLLKYAGIVVPIGENDDDRSEYLGVASSSSLSEQSWKEADKDERAFMLPPWSELAYLTLKCAKKSLVEWADKLELDEDTE